ncbi:MAG: hypothetical protein D6683_18160 [Actinomyces sp.]|nr:MAG: hypothetical protein D6683_18160 [Actinomyces sp.]
MSLRLALVAVLTGVNAWRLAPGVPGADAVERIRRSVLGGAVFVAVAALVAGVSGPLLDAVSVTAPTARIAAGVALAVVAVRDLVTAPPSPEPSLAGDGAALVPLVFPYLANPGIVLLLLSVGHDRGVAAAAALALAAGASLVAVAPVAPSRVTSRWWRAVGVVPTAVAVAAAVAVTVDGVLDI